MGHTKKNFTKYSRILLLRKSICKKSIFLRAMNLPNLKPKTVCCNKSAQMEENMRVQTTTRTETEI